MGRHQGRHRADRRGGRHLACDDRSARVVRAGAVGAVAVVSAVGSIAAVAVPASAATDRARWLLDESGATTTAFDSSGNGNDGTAYDTTGDGSSYLFNGVSSKVVVPTSDSLNPGTADFAFSITFATSVAPGPGEDYDMLRKGLAVTKGGEYKIEVINANGKARALCLVKDSNKVTAQIRGITNLADGLTHTITCAKTSTGVTMYVDGLAPRTKSVSSLGSVANTASLVIGAKAEGGDWYNGAVSEASVISS